MKRIYKLLNLIGALDVLGIIYAVIVTVTADRETENPTEDTTTDQIETKYTAAKIDIGSMYALKYNHGVEVYSFSLSPDETSWHWSDNPELPLDNNYFAAMASSLSDVTTELKLKVNDTELFTYGLDAPWLSITVSDNSYGTQVFSFGSLNAFTGQYYFNSSSDANTVYLVPADITKNFLYTPRDMISNDVIPSIAADSISSIHIDSPTEDVLYSVHSDKALDAWYVSYDGKDDEAEPVPEALASKLGGIFENISLGVPVGFSSDDRREFGLSEPTTVTVSYTEIKTVTDSQSGASTDVAIDAEFQLMLGYSNGDGKVYAGVPDSVLCYLVDSTLFSELCTMVTKPN